MDTSTTIVSTAQERQMVFELSQELVRDGSAAGWKDWEFAI